MSETRFPLVHVIEPCMSCAPQLVQLQCELELARLENSILRGESTPRLPGDNARLQAVSDRLRIAISTQGHDSTEIYSTEAGAVLNAVNAMLLRSADLQALESIVDGMGAETDGVSDGGTQ